uniref:ATP-dependent DNA helicase n=1 Tax=Anthurium amnicola TaxID=1678845 RepID=A0A1D1YAD1_9ARAE
MEATLKEFFGYSQFRPYQKEIIQQVLDGRDCLVVMATGSGKSLCYQIPPLLRGKTAIVISPLISLMQDQVMSLKQRGIKAEYLGSTQTDQNVNSVAESGKLDLLYMTPEKAFSLGQRFWTNLLYAGISLLAVDEAHCISEWGHDFRKVYKKLHTLRGYLLDIPFVGLTATATEKVREDIIKSLKMSNPYIAIGSFNRENLFYGVKSFTRVISFVDELVWEISKHLASGGSTIIYCTTIKDTEQIFEALRNVKIKAGMYHGQMDNVARMDSHRLFTRDELHVMVATVAFGMGVDKPNVRCVIHYGCPKSLESYYQESGRCGRDGLASICWLYYSRSDFAKADFYCGESNSEYQRKAITESLMAAEKYCLLSTCRRKFLLQYFGERVQFTTCGNCDVCLGSKRERDLSRESFLLLSCIQSSGGRRGLNMPVDILRGSRSKKIIDNNFDKLPQHGLGKDYSPTWWKALGGVLLTHDYLKETVTDIYRTVSVNKTGLQFLRSASNLHQPPLVLPLSHEMIDEEDCGGKQGRVEGDLQNLSALECEGFSEAEAKLYHMLLDVRMKLAKTTGTAPYAVCGDQTIKKITKIRPSTRARLSNIDGVNLHLVTSYGDSFIQSIEKLSQELGLSLDGDPSIVINNASPNSGRKLTPAKYDAWKMWQQDGLSVHEVANFPQRSAPIKERTVFEYILEAARERYEINWGRLCGEIGLTSETISEIHRAIQKIGSRDRMKPIKEELPEHVTYDHIKICLVMEDLGVSAEALRSNSLEVVKSSNEALVSHLPSNHHAPGKESQIVEGSPIDEMVLKSSEGCHPCNNVLSSCIHEDVTSRKQPRADDWAFEGTAEKKFHKITDLEEKTCKLEATQYTILEWLGKHEGVALSDILEHFVGSSKESVLDQLGCLEGQFLIFRKNDLYRVM